MVVRSYSVSCFISLWLSHDVCKCFKVVFACWPITQFHYHYCEKYIESIEQRICLSVIFCWMCVQGEIYSQRHLVYNVWGCVLSADHFSCDDRMDIRTSSHMMTSSNGNIFRATGLLCGEFNGHRWIPQTKVSDAELWCFLWSRQLSKQWRRWWFETLLRSLWYHCNGYHNQLGNKIRQPSLVVKSWNSDMCSVINISLSIRCDWTSMPVMKTLLICTP